MSTGLVNHALHAQPSKIVMFIHRYTPIDRYCILGIEPIRTFGYLLEGAPGAVESNKYIVPQAWRLCGSNHEPWEGDPSI